MSYYSIIPFVAFLVNFFLFSYFFATARQNKAGRAFLYFTASIALFEISELLLWSHMPDAIVGMMFKILAPVHLSVGFLLMNFVYSLIGKKKNYFYKTIMLLYFAIIIIQIFTDLYTDSNTINRYSWGTSAKEGPIFYPVLFALYILPSIYSLYLILKKNLTSENNLEKNSLHYYLQAFSLLQFSVLSQILFSR